MVGYPGSGKTTTSKIIHELTGAEHLWADRERKRMFGEPAYTHQENIELYEELNNRTDELLRAGKSVIFDTNFNFYKDREHLRRIAARNGATAFVIWVKAPKDIARERATKDANRQQTRVLGDMPVEQFERMARNLQEPRPDEHAVHIDGTRITTSYIADMLEPIKPATRA
jgi:predicted kinase